jgi:hypothetical protein
MIGFPDECRRENYVKNKGKRRRVRKNIKKGINNQRKKQEVKKTETLVRKITSTASL